MSRKDLRMTSNDGPRIAWAKIDQAHRLIPLFLELYVQTVPESEHISEPQVLDHIECLMASTTPHRLAIAWNDQDEPIGLAAAAIFVSVTECRPEHRVQMEMKELYVRTDLRSQGIGEAIMVWLETFARSQGVRRFDWHVHADNGRGQAFYQRIGAATVQDRLSMRKSL